MQRSITSRTDAFPCRAATWSAFCSLQLCVFKSSRPLRGDSSCGSLTDGCGCVNRCCDPPQTDVDRLGRNDSPAPRASHRLASLL